MPKSVKRGGRKSSGRKSVRRGRKSNGKRSGAKKSHRYSGMMGGARAITCLPTSCPAFLKRKGSFQTCQARMNPATGAQSCAWV